MLHLENNSSCEFPDLRSRTLVASPLMSQKIMSIAPPNYFNNSVPNGTEPPLQIRDKTTRPSVTAVSWSRYAFPPRRSLTGPSLHPRHPRKKAKIHSHFDRDATRTVPPSVSATRKWSARRRRRDAVEEPPEFIYRFTIT